jgi:F0F1-type ATP synthase assembly protein I
VSRYQIFVITKDVQTKDQSQQNNYKMFLIIGMSTAILLVSPVIILLILGYFLDNLFHTSPLFILVGVSLGFVGGVMNVFKLMRIKQRAKKQTTQNKNTVDN